MSDFASRRMTMVDTQVRPSDVTKFPIIEAMLHIPRETYVPAALRDAAYAGAHVPLAPGRVLLEARTMAKMLDALDIRPDELVLDLGAGLGYSTALLARLAETVVGVEEDEALAAEAARILGQEGVDNAIIHQAPLVAGAAKHGPYDVIVIEGGIEELPDAIADQLKEGGRIAAVEMNGALGTVKHGLKRDGRIDWRFAFNAAAPVLPGFGRAAAFSL
ncbi:protein-L-isoaspartate O-methyltransferase family protein [Pseudogemmobacter faecipullorum]|uniref:Protein-L-isoaspartate O-methyltransferase n=1 Tax=Pseudogemmobacter faecipullorum TaxID=2755041 RepID=A0ABS8CIR1_9RHOB|nr:protein-L-isoaspartate O-methyltransferase [Pseudogemmobacter faecipullorum]MCB5409266.1 protein-L-isoaspartate O-methyltransferase [Pseudogemmobacter faecipullorum]